MDRIVDAGELIGITALIARRGSIVYQHTVGTLDAQTGAPLKDDSLLRIYSMTKPITSVAAMILVEEGRLHLDEPVSRFFPEWAGQTAYEDDVAVPVKTPVTTRHLLMHTSGLSYGYYGDTAVDRAYRAAKLIDDWDYLTHDTRELVEKLAVIPLLFQPGTRWHYGFSSDVLGHLTERVSGDALDEFMRKRLLEPLGMTDTYFDVPIDKRHRFGTDQYIDDEGNVTIQDSPREDPEFIDVTFLSGGGGLVTTAENYMRFCLMLRNGGMLGEARILKPATVQLMTRDLLPAGISAGSANAGFGLGFRVERQTPSPPGALSAGTYSWGGAAGTFFWIDPVEDIIAVFMPQRIGSPRWIQTNLQNLVYAAVIENTTVRQ
jgi:CubicO group peptidase (beta-lactamase class C family)